MAPEHQRTQATRLQERYEELRRYVSGGWCAGECSEHSGPSKTMLIFIGEGMAAWMRAWDEVTPVRSLEGARPRESGVPQRTEESNRAGSLSAWSEQAVNLLADLALARLQGSFS
jgi:hypothetical protein